jgi:hypothetical protein
MQNAEPDHVDPSVAYEGFASLKNHDGNPVKAVQAAYNNAVKSVLASGRKPVMLRVIVHVEPQTLAFDDTPLAGGVCDMTPGCESCQ